MFVLTILLFKDTTLINIAYASGSDATNISGTVNNLNSNNFGVGGFIAKFILAPLIGFLIMIADWVVNLVPNILHQHG